MPRHAHNKFLNDSLTSLSPLSLLFFVDCSPNPMGAAMAAFLKTEYPQLSYSLLLYYTAQKPIAKINITPDFNYVVRDFLFVCSVCVCLVCSVCVYLCVCAEEGEKD
jgi:hypothetical protein